MPRIPPELTAAGNAGGKDPMTRLGQAAHIVEIDELGCGEWTILYEYLDNPEGSRCFYSGLLMSVQVAKALEDDSWDLSIGDGAPGFSRKYSAGGEVVTYERFSLDGVEPILYSRSFHDISM